MNTFIEEVLSQINKQDKNLSQAVFILPSKRAVGFLKRYLSRQLNIPIFSPKIISIEEFIEEISGLKIIDSLTLLFSSYAVYLNTHEFPEKDSFEEYTSWGQAILNDFNEIDRYLVPKSEFFNYLLSIQTLEKWGVKDHQTPFVKQYLSFWQNLETFYENLNDAFAQEQRGYQGMVYRKAAEDMEHYLAAHGNRNHYFMGFNALNNAEQSIIQELLETGNTTVFWDMDSHLFADQEHAASFFLRNYKKTWNYYKHNPISIIDSCNTNKKITIAEAQNDIGQVKYVAQLLSDYPPEILDKTAIVLADESLLTPLLYSLPNVVDSVNVTMGLPIKDLPEVDFFDYILDLYQNPDPFYYKKLELLLLHPWVKKLLVKPENILQFIKTNNLSSISYQKLLAIGGTQNEEVIKLLFNTNFDSIDEIVKNFQSIIQKLFASISLTVIEKSILSKIEEIFETITLLTTQFDYLKSPLSLKNAFSQLVSKASLDFEGNPEKGLQIMGILETRVIDFENIILLSVNEGILPSGKTNNSFITYDLKLQFGLPLHPEKDAVYAYHFYHLLFRAKQSTFVYSSQSKGLRTGEKSRFLLQLEIDEDLKGSITHKVQTSTLLHHRDTLKKIEKTSEIIVKLQKIAENGFSPSALLSYVRNPIDFYFERILGINDTDAVEETIEYNTLGTIVHEALEKLYVPFIKTLLSVEELSKCLKRVPAEVIQQFQNHFKEGDFSKGKNLIIFEIAKRYVENLINLDIDSIKNGNTIKILALEESLKTELQFSEINYPIFLKGNVDRIDLFNDQLRIIDYKTGKVEQKELDLIDWENLTQDYKYSKAFQVLAYAYLYQKKESFNEVLAGIISFKNLSAGFMSFRKKDAPRSTKGELRIDSDVLINFESELKSLILEIMDINTPFIEKEIAK